MTRTPDFGARAEVYDRLRPVDERWWRLFELLVGEADLRGQRVLDVGCGTGNLCTALAERGLAKVWGVDPERRMLDVARGRVPRGVGLKAGRAEELPFRDEWFDRVVFWLSVHLVDRPRAFAEAHRVLVPGGGLALVTFAPEQFPTHWLVRWFPSIERIDRARFPTPEQLDAELPAAGFEPPRFLRLTQDYELRRDDALARIRGRHISSFDLLDENELREGTARAERELPERLGAALHWLVVVAVRAGG